MTKARTAPGSSGASVSGTSGTLEPHGRRRCTVAPGVACTVRGIPSSRGRASVPAGVKLVVSIHTVRPGGGRNCGAMRAVRSEEHTSELQSRFDLVCRLLLEKKKHCVVTPAVVLRGEGFMVQPIRPEPCVLRLVR